ncbi:MAG: helix-turn-helix domain-containing protein [Verrucomicrobiales bacterium]
MSDDAIQEKKSVKIEKVFFTKKELAESLGLSVKTIERYLRAKRIPCYRISRQTVRFKLDEVLESLEKFKVRTR